MLYLDHNSTTNIHPEVKKLINNIIEGEYNASSTHTKGRYSYNLIEKARQQIAKSLNFDLIDYNIIFTSSGTESNNLILYNYYDGEIFISNIEHASIFNHIKHKNNIQIINVDKNGIVDSKHLKNLLITNNNPKKLVSIMLANNESGVVQNIKKLIKITKKYGGTFHSDCVQAFGKIHIDIKKLEIDFVTISGHKIGGGHGSSALIYRLNYNLKPIIIGGGQEKNIRSGTENVVSIAALGLASSLAKTDLIHRHKKMQKLQTYLEKKLQEYRGITIVSQNVTRLPNTTLIIIPNTDSQVKLIVFDLYGIAISNGSACSSGKVKQSHVLSAMGFNEQDIKSAIRVSFDYNQNLQDITTFLCAFEKIYSLQKIETQKK